MWPGKVPGFRVNIGLYKDRGKQNGNYYSRIGYIHTWGLWVECVRLGV